MSLGKFQIFVKRDGPIWQGKELCQFHTNDEQDALWYARHSVKLTWDVAKVELRADGRPATTVYERSRISAP